MADQTPDPIDVIAGAVGGMLGHGYEPEIAKVALEALKAAGLQVTPIPDAETLAQRFHEAYERLAPEYGYETRPDSAVPWNDVPEQNRALMVAVCREMALPIPDADTRQEVETLVEAIKAMRPDPSEPAPPGWDADDRRGDRNIYRAAELLTAAYLSEGK